MSDFLAIREIVNEFDPMGLIGMGAPDDVQITDMILQLTAL